ncbi:hypothetical protein FACS1894188_04290 [Clostridia bacterium]|nr:hypothetical protein FACS1894188_04290 [Clostridia bacterium]
MNKKGKKRKRKKNTRFGGLLRFCVKAMILGTVTVVTSLPNSLSLDAAYTPAYVTSYETPYENPYENPYKNMSAIPANVTIPPETTVIEPTPLELANEQKNDGAPLIIGHKGLPTAYFENTVASFQAAADSEAYAGIETDVWFTSDGVPVLAHDGNPFAGVDKYITEMTYDKVSKLKLYPPKSPYSRKGEAKIATFGEYLNICINANKLAFIEIKQPGVSDSQIRKLIDTIKNANYTKSCFFMSFDENTVAACKRLAPSSIRVMQLASNSQPHDVYYYVDNGLSINAADVKSKISEDWGIPITAELVDAVHERGQTIGVWTVNSIERAKELKALGVDFITTDYSNVGGK